VTSISWAKHIAPHFADAKLWDAEYHVTALALRIHGDWPSMNPAHTLQRRFGRKTLLTVWHDAGRFQTVWWVTP